MTIIILTFLYKAIKAHRKKRKERAELVKAQQDQKGKQNVIYISDYTNNSYTSTDKKEIA